MEHRPLHVERRPELLASEDHRVITRYLEFHNRSRLRAMIRRILQIPEDRLGDVLGQVKTEFVSRHRDMENVFLDHYEAVRAYCGDDASLSPARKLLIGAYFTMEYSIEAAALFNPSIVMHPDQGGLDAGSIRFLLSLRATGEGHISSIVFRRGVIDAGGTMTFDPPPRYAYSAKAIPRSRIDKHEFLHQLLELGAPEELTISVLMQLGDRFDVKELYAVTESIRQSGGMSGALGGVVGDMEWLARANYELRYPADCRPAEIVIFPATESERHGMEDLRLVRFVGDDGRVRYLGTYTAYDGRRMLPMMLATGDFTTFRVSTLVGKYARDKDLALFPRKVSGRYAMIGRCDGVHLYYLTSDSLSEWNEGHKLIGPREPWELTQIGNCGSPLETDAGWLLLTHGVGPVRRYCLGAMLLDRADPSRVIGRLREPLMSPGADEREGYVPNVLYSCGSMIYRGQLVIPYAMSDTRTAFATVAVAELLDLLIASGP